MKPFAILLLLVGSVGLCACASNRANHPMVKAADRVIEEITQSPANGANPTTLAAKPATENP